MYNYIKSITLAIPTLLPVIPPHGGRHRQPGVTLSDGALSSGTAGVRRVGEEMGLELSAETRRTQTYGVE